jgi:hypothetical protein
VLDRRLQHSGGFEWSFARRDIFEERFVVPRKCRWMCLVSFLLAIVFFSLASEKLTGWHHFLQRLENVFGLHFSDLGCLLAPCRVHAWLHVVSGKLEVHP